jgi:hypothetical protein
MATYYKAYDYMLQALQHVYSMSEANEVAMDAGFTVVHLGEGEDKGYRVRASNGVSWRLWCRESIDENAGWNITEL